MADDTLTLVLEGEVSLADFSKAISSFQDLVLRLTTESTRSPVQWILAALEVSSAVTAVRGSSPEAEVVEAVVRACEHTARQAEQGNYATLPEPVRRPIEKLLSLMDGRVTGIRFETPREEMIIRPSAEGTTPSPPELHGPELGAVDGRIQTLSSRGGLRFTLYDTHFDKAVSCYLQEGFEDLMRDAWGRRAVIEGVVRRDPDAGRPLTVRQITQVTLLPELTKTYKDARGLLPRSGEPSESAIRRVRDA